ncbi:MAG TPA: protein kinase [Gemmatimonadaceae bacterium]|nr:protein kinase [Gemmatimonadaceae bacterium]
MESEQLREQLQASLGANYALERELGGGGMSRVYVATEKTLGRTVVVKVLPPDLAHAVSVERFRREIAMAARLQHPHIVPLLTAGEADGLPYYTMPYIDGESLRARLARVGELPLADIIRVLRDVTGALAYAHEHGVVHRDIKPENVLLTRQHALVVDFGVAKALSASTMAGVASSTSLGIALGTPAYMAPEQAAADPTTDGRADLYALGAMTYEMLTGSPPFGGRSAQATLAAHAGEAATPVATRRATTPPVLAGLVMQLLEKRPADRPQSADAVLEAIDGISTTSGTMLPFTPTKKKARVPAWFIAGVAAVLVVGAIAAMAKRNRSASELAAMSGMTTADIAQHSVAVLPFANVGKDTATEYFADGMADELTTALARVPGLKVAARSSAFTFRDQSVGAQHVGKTLHVGNVLEGSVRREGGRLRVTAQLVNTATGLASWSDSYEREMKDVFQVQDELTHAIIAALYPTLASSGHDSAETARLAVAHAPRGTSDLSAYDLFLQGRHYFGWGGAPSLWKAIGFFQQAIAADSTFARAHAALAMSYDLLPDYGGAPADSVIPLAEAHAQRALALDPGLADAHLALGDVRVHQWRWADAERELDRSVSLDPSNPTVHLWHAELLLGMGEVADAVGHAKMAQALDPLTATTNQTLSRTLLDARQYGEAAKAATRGLAIDSTFGGLYVSLMEAEMLGGHADSAARVADRALRIARRGLGVRSASIWAYTRAGRTHDADALMVEMRRDQSVGTVPALEMAHALLAFGQTDSALVWIGRSVARHDAEPDWNGLACDPTYDALRKDQRFIALMAPTGMRICGSRDAKAT